MEVIDSQKYVEVLGCIPAGATDSSLSYDKISRLYCFEWTVSDYCFFKCLPEGASSPDFKVGQHEADTMKIRLSPSCDRNKLKIQVSLHRTQIKDFSELSSIKYDPFSGAALNLEFLDFSGKILDNFTLIPDVISNPNYYNWIKEENVESFVENDSLKIRVKLCMKYMSILDKSKPSRSKSFESLVNDMEKLVGGNYSPDLAIKVAGKRFLVHKCILLPQFAFVAKLYSETRDILSTEEGSSNTSDSLTTVDKDVCIPNENAEVFQSVLHYLYTGKLCTANTFNDFELYEFAQRYQLDELGRHLKPQEMYLRTQAQKSQIAFYWHVNDYSVRSLDKFNIFRSPVYKNSVGTKGISWGISLFFDSESIFLSLERVEGFDINVQTTFRLMVCKPDGTTHEERQFVHCFESEMRIPSPGFLDPESRFMISSTLLFDDTLMLRCEITVSEGQLTSFASQIYPGKPPESDFKNGIKNLQNLLESGNFSDASILVDEEEFKVHKAILSARSPVFAKMFETDMTEKLNGSVKIEDISCATLKCALMYIYTGTLGILNTCDVPGLYRTADKYEIWELKERYAEFILGNLEPDNACEILILSDLFGEKKIKEAAMNLICQNASQSLMADSGKELIANHPHLALDIFDNLSAAFCSHSRPHAHAVRNKFMSAFTR